MAEPRRPQIKTSCVEAGICERGQARALHALLLPGREKNKHLANSFVESPHELRHRRAELKKVNVLRAIVFALILPLPKSAPPRARLFLGAPMEVASLELEEAQRVYAAALQALFEQVQTHEGRDALATLSVEMTPFRRHRGGGGGAAAASARRLGLRAAY